MTVDEIVQKIYEERYTDPKDPAIATTLRDVMIREIVERALELATGSLALEFVAARRAHTTTWATVVAWMMEAKARGEPAWPARAPEWRAFESADNQWRSALTKLDAWIGGQEAVKP